MSCGTVTARPASLHGGRQQRSEKRNASPNCTETRYPYSGLSETQAHQKTMGRHNIGVGNSIEASLLLLSNSG